MRTQALIEELRARLGVAPPAGDGAGARAGAREPRLPRPEPARDPALLERLRAATVAQIGVGRAGTRLRTRTLLEFLAGRAVAVEAVQSQLPDDFARAVGAVVAVRSRAKDLQEFLFRPDLGRQLPPDELARVVAACRKGPDVQPIVGDGLSAKAVVENAPPFLAALRDECKRLGLEVGDTVLVKHARVKLLDPIGAALGARTAVICVGERPALGTGDGMSAYLMWGPRADAMDSDREVVSNINARSFKPEEAGRRTAAMLAEFLRVGASGVKRQAGPAPAAPGHDKPRAAALAAVAR